MTQKQKKRAIIIGVILAVLLITGITGSLLLRANQPLYTKLSIALMPDTLDYTDEETGEKITFYIEQNKDYDKEKDDPIDAYKTYYLDEKEEKVYLENGIYISDKEFAESKKIGQKEDDTKDGVKTNVGQGAQVTVGFLISAQNNANKVKTVVKVLVALFALCCVAYLIYLWYLNWSVREDKKKKKLEEAEKKLSDKSE